MPKARSAIARGADLNAGGQEGRTPLIAAAMFTRPEIVKLLLEHGADPGADPNTMNGGKYTALDYAVDRAPVWTTAPRGDRAKIVRALLAAGARKDRKGADRVLPIERARRAGYPELAALLSEAK